MYKLQGKASPFQEPLIDLIRAAGRLCLPAARMRRKSNTLVRKGTAFPHSRGAKPLGTPRMVSNLTALFANRPYTRLARRVNQGSARTESYSVLFGVVAKRT